MVVRDAWSEGSASEMVAPSSVGAAGSAASTAVTLTGGSNLGPPEDGSKAAFLSAGVSGTPTAAKTGQKQATEAEAGKVAFFAADGAMDPLKPNSLQDPTPPKDEKMEVPKAVHSPGNKFVTRPCPPGLELGYEALCDPQTPGGVRGELWLTPKEWALMRYRPSVPYGLPEGVKLVLMDTWSETVMPRPGQRAHARGVAGRESGGHARGTGRRRVAAMDMGKDPGLNTRRNTRSTGRQVVEAVDSEEDFVTDVAARGPAVARGRGRGRAASLGMQGAVDIAQYQSVKEQNQILMQELQRMRKEMQSVGAGKPTRKVSKKRLVSGSEGDDSFERDMHHRGSRVLDADKDESEEAMPYRGRGSRQKPAPRKQRRASDQVPASAIPTGRLPKAVEPAKGQRRRDPIPDRHLAPVGPAVLTKEEKTQLQMKIDRLNDEQLDKVFEFLAPDLGDGSNGDDVQLDLDTLPAHRQHALVKVVDAELASLTKGTMPSVSHPTAEPASAPLETLMSPAFPLVEPSPQLATRSALPAGTEATSRSDRAQRSWEECCAREVQRQSQLREVREAASGNTPQITPNREPAQIDAGFGAAVPELVLPPPAIHRGGGAPYGQAAAFDPGMRHAASAHEAAGEPGRSAAPSAAGAQSFVPQAPPTLTDEELGANLGEQVGDSMLASMADVLDMMN